MPNEKGKLEAKVVGRFGIEAAMQESLAGRDGWRQHHRDARGLVVPGNSGSLLPPRAGLNVQLTIDMGLQAIVEEEMEACQLFGSMTAVVYVIVRQLLYILCGIELVMIWK